MTSPLLPPPETVRVLCWVHEFRPPIAGRYEMLIRAREPLVAVVERREIPPSTR